MLLIVMQERVTDRATGRSLIDRPSSFVSALDLHVALAELKQYRQAYASKFPDVRLEFQLLTVSEIKSFDFDDATEFKCELIEDLVKSFGTR